jgi:hypothetical protein
MRVMTAKRAARPSAALILGVLGTAVAVATGGGTPLVHAQSASAASTRSQPAGSFTYAPGTRRYQLTTVVDRSQNQAGGRAPFEFTTTTMMNVTLTLARRSRDTLVLALTVDSVAVTSDLDAPAANVSAYKGAKLTGLISPQGRIYRFEPPARAAEPLPGLYRSFRRFLVPFPSADIAPGAVWSDTTTTPVKVGGFDTKTVAIMNSRVASDTVYDGQRAWRIDRTGSITIAGSAAAPTDTVGLTGDGTIHATDYVAVAGIFLGNTSTQTTQLQQFKPNQPAVQGVPIQQTIKSSVRPI